MFVYHVPGFAVHTCLCRRQWEIRQTEARAIYPAPKAAWRPPLPESCREGPFPPCLALRRWHVLGRFDAVDGTSFFSPSYWTRFAAQHWEAVRAAALNRRKSAHRWLFAGLDLCMCGGRAPAGWRAARTSGTEDAVHRGGALNVGSDGNSGRNCSGTSSGRSSGRASGLDGAWPARVQRCCPNVGLGDSPETGLPLDGTSME